MINYCHYPFLPGARMRVTGFDKESISHCEKHIERYTPTNILEIDIPVWLTYTVILRNLENNFVTRKFISNYGKLFENFISKDIVKKDERYEVLEYFGLQAKEFTHVYLGTETFIKIPIMDYLELQENYQSEDRFKLVNQVLEKGFVVIEKPRFVYLLRLVLESKLLKKIHSMKKHTEDKLLNEAVNRLSELYPKYEKRVQDPNLIPLSIKQLIDKAYNEHHLGHSERIKLGIYLQGRGFDMDYILDIFKQLSDYKEKVTLYQLQSLKRYVK